MSEDYFTLPANIMTQFDLGRVARELESLEEFLVEAKVRQPGTPMVLPKTSQLLEETASANKFNLLEANDRAKLKTAFEYLKKTAPRLHISFATEPSNAFLQKIVVWLRQEIHPQTIVKIGLQPSIAAGCIIRTPNKVFDFSLRANLSAQNTKLIELMRSQ